MEKKIEIKANEGRVNNLIKLGSILERIVNLGKEKSKSDSILKVYNEYLDIQPFIDSLRNYSDSVSNAMNKIEEIYQNTLKKKKKDFKGCSSIKDRKVY